MPGKNRTEASIRTREAVKAGGPMPFLADPNQSGGEEAKRISQTLSAGEADRQRVALGSMVTGKRKRKTSPLTDLVRSFQ